MRKVKKLLLVRADRMGDVVLTTPIFRAIKEQLPDIFLSLLVAKENFDLVRNHPFLDEVIPYDKSGTEGNNPIGALGFVTKIRIKHFDAVVHFHPRARFYWISFLAGIPIRIGYRYKNYQLLTHAINYNKPEGSRHEAEYNFDLITSLGVKAPNQIEPLIVWDGKLAAKIKNYRELDRLFAVFNPSASSPSKLWPAEFFAELADQMSAQYHLLPVIIGGASDVMIGNKMEHLMKTKPLNLTGKIDLGSLPWLFSKSQITVSNDTGPAHVAAATGARVISIFTRNLPGLGPERWRPIGKHARYLMEPVVQSEEEANKRHLKPSDFREILPARVLREIEPLLTVKVT